MKCVVEGMKYVRKTVSLILSIIIANVFVAYAYADADKNAIRSSDFLTCCGTMLKKKSGMAVVLRGTNLGGWLVYENWMCPIDGVESSIELINTLTERFGEEKAQELICTYQDSFITESDLDIMADMCFNCIRVPFWYRTLQTDDNGTWRRNTQGEIDFSRLDWIVEECGKRGMYVILDAHGLPGFQNSSDNSGSVNTCSIYDNTDEGERFRALACEFWKEIAAHFRGNPAVAAYDLMNEPQTNFEDGGENDRTIQSLYKSLYHAVRSVDKNHIITVEAIWRYSNLGDPVQYGWKNVMYQLHLYESNASDYSPIIAGCNGLNYKVPMYIGEFKPLAAGSDWQKVLDVITENRCNWTSWTYKGYCRWGSSSDWFIMGTDDDEKLADVRNDSFETIKDKWSSGIKTENGFRKMGVSDKLEVTAKIEIEYTALDYFKAVFDEIMKMINRRITTA